RLIGSGAAYKIPSLSNHCASRLITAQQMPNLHKKAEAGDCANKRLSAWGVAAIRTASGFKSATNLLFCLFIASIFEK
ncbi:MAG: hypothetical protein PUB61_10615, partial [Bacteroidales bacterium]|nr:hypothetical protein [Bacteroidales bacterium]